jgi:uncharacterized protein (DUF1501 family)
VRGFDSHQARKLFTSGFAFDQRQMMRESLWSPLSTFVRKLKSAEYGSSGKSYWEYTHIVITSEFGRPAEFDGGGGRGHQGSAFTCVLAGGGLKHRGAFGETDELAATPVRDPVTVPDFFATILAAVGIDYTANLYNGDRPIPITDNGRPIAALFG